MWQKPWMEGAERGIRVDVLAWVSGVRVIFV